MCNCSKYNNCGGCQGCSGYNNAIGDWLKKQAENVSQTVSTAGQTIKSGFDRVGTAAGSLIGGGSAQGPAPTFSTPQVAPMQFNLPEQKKGLSTMSWVAIIGASALVLTASVIAIVKSRKN